MFFFCLFVCGFDKNKKNKKNKKPKKFLSFSFEFHIVWIDYDTTILVYTLIEKGGGINEFLHSITNKQRNKISETTN